ncbi:MAG: hypothetical protein H7Y11_12315, partial [Armatimonadetes bacterium]|nr:hypothetical protein [Anaerolineae bacterium]
MRYTRGEIVSAGLGLLMPMLAALAVFPLYAAALLLTDSPAAARQAGLWWALVPSVALFAPTWNTVYPALCILSFSLLLRGLIRRRLRWVVLAGVVLSVTTFLNFAVLPVLLLFGVFTVGYWAYTARHASDAPDGLWLVAQGVWFGIGLLSVWVAFWLVSGYTPWDILRVTFSSHNDLVQQRAYLPWLILHPYDVALLMGFPLIGLAVWGIVQAVRRWRFTPLDMLALATGLTVLLVNALGIVQGENGRILSFYAPFLLLAGVGAANDHLRRPLLIAQAVMFGVLAAVLAVIPLDLNPQSTTPRTDLGGLGDALAFIPSDTGFTSPVYTGAFRLAEYRYIADPASQAITFEFVWEGDAPTERPYHFELSASASNALDGTVNAVPLRWQPQSGSYLTTCWRSGQRVRDVVVLALPPVSMPVVWQPVLSAVDERTANISMISTSDGVIIDKLVLNPVQYP